jgi:hypothetical protein
MSKNARPPIKIGQRFGRLTVIERCEKDKFGNYTWRCICDCGNKTMVRASYLKSGTTKSCGCLKKENRITHGDSYTRLYHIWYGIIRRTEDSNRKEYKDYGGRGIKICPEWRNSYEAFRDWALRNGYTDNLLIDRINKDDDYSPSNCRWISRKEQSLNRSDTRRLTVNGITKTLSEWARHTGMPYAKLKKRVRLGWPDEKVISEK